MESSLNPHLRAELSLEEKGKSNSSNLESREFRIAISVDPFGRESCPQVIITKFRSQQKVHIEIAKNGSFFRSCQVLGSALAQMRDLTVNTQELLEFLKRVEEESEYTKDADFEFYIKKAQIRSFIPDWYKEEFDRNQDLTENVIRLLQFDSLCKHGWYTSEEVRAHLDYLHTLAAKKENHVISQAWQRLKDRDYPLYIFSKKDGFREIVEKFTKISAPNTSEGKSLGVDPHTKKDTKLPEFSSESMTNTALAATSEILSQEPHTEAIAEPKVDWSNLSAKFAETLASSLPKEQADELVGELAQFTEEQQQQLISELKANHNDDVQTYINSVKVKAESIVQQAVEEYFKNDFAKHEQQLGEQKPKVGGSLRPLVGSPSKGDEQRVFGPFSSEFTSVRPSDPLSAAFFDVHLVTAVEIAVFDLRKSDDSAATEVCRKVAEKVAFVGGEGILNRVEVLIFEALLSRVYAKELAIASYLGKLKQKPEAESVQEFWQQVSINLSDKGQPLSKQLVTEYLKLRPEDTTEAIRSRIQSAQDCYAGNEHSWGLLRSALDLIDAVKSKNLLPSLITESQKNPTEIIDYLVSFYSSLFGELFAEENSTVLQKNLEQILSSTISEGQVHALTVAVWREIISESKPHSRKTPLLFLLLSKVIEQKNLDPVAKGMHAIAEQNSHGKALNTNLELYTKVNKYLIASGAATDSSILIWEFKDYDHNRGEILAANKLTAAVQIRQSILGKSTESFNKTLEQQLCTDLLSESSEESHLQLSCWLTDRLLSATKSTETFATLRKTVQTLKRRTVANGWGISTEYVANHGAFLDRVLLGQVTSVQSLDQALDFVNLLNVDGLVDNDWRTLEQCLPEGGTYIRYLRRLYLKTRSTEPPQPLTDIERLQTLAHAIAATAPSTFAYSVAALKSASFFPPMINWEDEDTRACLTLMHEKAQPGCTKGGYYRCIKCQFPVLSDQKGTKFTCLQDKNCKKCSEKLGPFTGSTAPNTTRAIPSKDLEEMLESKRSEVPTQFILEGLLGEQAATKFEEAWVLMKYPDIKSRAYALAVYFVQHLFYSVWLGTQSDSAESNQLKDAVPAHQNVELSNWLINRDWHELCSTLSMNPDAVTKKMWLLIYNLPTVTANVTTAPQTESNPFVEGSSCSFHQSRPAICNSLKLDNQSLIAEDSALSDYQQKVNAFFDRREWALKMMTGTTDISNYAATQFVKNMNALFSESTLFVPVKGPTEAADDDEAVISESLSPKQDLNEGFRLCKTD